MRWTGSGTRLIAVMFGVPCLVSVGAEAGNAVRLATEVPADAGEYVVRPGDTLWGIAASELGDPYRWPEIAAVSAPIVQRRGMRLVDPDLIRPGWTLALPANPGQGAWDSGTGFSMVRLGPPITVLDELVVNNSGQVAGSRAAHGFSDRAFLWDPRAGARDLGAAVSDEEWSRAAQGLNEQGQVVGIASRFVEDRQEDHTFFWDPATGMHDLGTAPLGNSVRVIDERGLVTGTSMTPEDLAAMASPNSDYRGVVGVFQWDLAAGRRDLGTLDPNAWYVVDINDKGQVAYVVESDSFRWDPDTGEQQIDRLDEGDSRATAINAAGQMVGALWTDGREGSRAFVWDPDEGTRDLGTLAGPRSEATAINARGQVAGIARTAQGSDQTSHAWRWDPVTGIDDLGHAFEVADINEKGQVVGTSRTTAGHYQAWLWDPVTGRVNLGAPGDHDTTASALNDRGQVAGWAGTIPWEIEYSDDEELAAAGDAVLWTPIGS